jgi:hypothetical protein
MVEMEGSGQNRRTDDKRQRVPENDIPDPATTAREALSSFRCAAVVIAKGRAAHRSKSCLSPEQLADYDRTRSFVVIGGHTRNPFSNGLSTPIFQPILGENLQPAVGDPSRSRC